MLSGCGPPAKSCFIAVRDAARIFTTPGSGGGGGVVGAYRFPFVGGGVGG
jgi:hypothetical protein